MNRFIFSILFMFHFSSAQEGNIPTVLENRKGIEALKKQNPAAAQKHFLDALSENPLDSVIQLNLGYSLEQLGQLEKARAAYDTVAKFGKGDQALFAAHFNRGVLYQKEKKIPEALAAYQEALKYNSSSVETKTNIELLTQDNQGQGKGESEEKKDGNQGNDSKDQKDENKDPKDDKENEKDGDQQKDEKKPKQYEKPKPQPKPFKSEELTQGDVNKILGEIKQQEQKIRAEFNKKDSKDQGKEKDW